MASRTSEQSQFTAQFHWFDELRGYVVIVNVMTLNLISKINLRGYVKHTFFIIIMKATATPERFGSAWALEQIQILITNKTPPLLPLHLP